VPDHLANRLAEREPLWPLSRHFGVALGIDVHRIASVNDDHAVCLPIGRQLSLGPPAHTPRPICGTIPPCHAIEANQLPRAEQIFKKLTLAQPEHCDGYYGLAQAYQRQRQLDLAILFADEAIRLGQVFIDDGTLDPITMTEMKAFRLQLGTRSGPAS
jgi:hypothetical protein